ncbi:receptor-like protein EIX2 [Salvia hispanica]|uniref:receptor-like protein EIX2 n=1 Tax=Salvia hispanica TaxID=49212 RepID=UPI0020092E77|nr:receptor-like protein EIX2 [Salvia hispanica]
MSQESMIFEKRIAIKFVLVVLSCVFVSGDAEVRCIESEREALLSFKNGTIDEDGFLSSWRSNECCEWDGVECSNTTGHVIALKCDNFGLQGELRSSLVELHHLIHLDLSWNDFGGIPIPEFIGSMKQLQHLSLHDSNFSGVVPPQFGNLTNLRSLDLSFNSLTSMSLSILGSVLESLQILNLSGNQFNGSIPDLRPFPSLTHLDLSGNNFTGPIPLSLGQLSELQNLYLSYNSLEGLVSESHFIKLDKLTTLDLSFNPLLNLDIAPDWSPPFQLSRIYLAECDVGPYFPKWIRSQRNLSSLDLTSANIRDEVPIWLWNTSSLLDVLSLSDNQISGTIPNLSSTSIMFMDVSYNQFSGPIPLFPATTYEIH